MARTLVIEDELVTAKETATEPKGHVAGRHGPIRLLATRAPEGETILVGRDTGQIIGLRRRVLLDAAG